mgnify:CR=1 FL=1
MKKVSVLFVCMGNICRSPTAEGVFRHLVRQEELEHLVHTDSAGTHAYHVGNPPDTRAQATAERRGIELHDLRARRVSAEDFDVWDDVVAMDRDNLEIFSVLCPPGYETRLRLFMEFAPELNIPEGPDPYYGGDSGFERVFDMVEEASKGLLQDIRRQLEK